MANLWRSVCRVPSIRTGMLLSALFLLLRSGASRDGARFSASELSEETCPAEKRTGGIIGRCSKGWSAGASQLSLDLSIDSCAW